MNPLDPNSKLNTLPPEDSLSVFFEKIKGSSGTIKEKISTVVQKIISLRTAQERGSALVLLFREFEKNFPASERVFFAKMVQHELHLRRSSFELVQVLKDLVWPGHAREIAEYERFVQNLAVSPQELDFANCDEGEYKRALIRKFEEAGFHQRGFVPAWVESKRDNPRAQASMLKGQTNSLHALGFIRGDTSVLNYPHPYGGEGLGESSGFQGGGYLSNPDLIAISEKLTTKGSHGDFRYVAGLQKGGLPGILDICVDGAIYTPWVGPLSLDADRDISQGRHGPWYAVLRSDFDDCYKPFGYSYEIPISQIEVILVEHSEDRSFLLNALNNAAALKLIDPRVRDDIALKVKTYSESAAYFN